MGITDKARRAQRAEISRQDLQSSTLAVVNPVLKRLRSVLYELSDFVAYNGDEKQKRMTKILGVIIDESMEEMGDMDSRVLAAWMHSMACVIEWTATGDIDVLPPELIQFACKVEGIAIPEQKQAEETQVVDAEIVG